MGKGLGGAYKWVASGQGRQAGLTRGIALPRPPLPKLPNLLHPTPHTPTHPHPYHCGPALVQPCFLLVMPKIKPSHCTNKIGLLASTASSLFLATNLLWVTFPFLIPPQDHVTRKYKISVVSQLIVSACFCKQVLDFFF